MCCYTGGSIVIRTQIQLTKKQRASLEKLASDRHISMAEAIRQSIDLYLRNLGTVSPGEKRKEPSPFRENSTQNTRIFPSTMINIWLRLRQVKTIADISLFTFWRVKTGIKKRDFTMHHNPKTMKARLSKDEQDIRNSFEAEWQIVQKPLGQEKEIRSYAPKLVKKPLCQNPHLEYDLKAIQ